MPQLIEIYRLSQSLFYICSMTELNIIWFRRDLRVHDHAALASACAAGGQIVPLFIFEPNYWQRADTSERQFEFAVESLADLDRALRQRGSQLCLRSGVVTEVLSRLHRFPSFPLSRQYACRGGTGPAGSHLGAQGWDSPERAYRDTTFNFAAF